MLPVYVGVQLEIDLVRTHVREAVVGIVESGVVVRCHRPTSNFEPLHLVGSVVTRRNEILVEILDALNRRRQGAIFYVGQKGRRTVGRLPESRSVEVSRKLGRELLRRVFESIQLMLRVDVFDAHLIILAITNV